MQNKPQEKSKCCGDEIITYNAKRSYCKRCNKRCPTPQEKDNLQITTMLATQGPKHPQTTGEGCKRCKEPFNLTINHTCVDGGLAANIERQKEVTNKQYIVPPPTTDKGEEKKVTKNKP